MKRAKTFDDFLNNQKNGDTKVVCGEHSLKEARFQPSL